MFDNFSRMLKLDGACRPKGRAQECAVNPADSTI
jgi:hypothetical protein